MRPVRNSLVTILLFSCFQIPAGALGKTKAPRAKTAMKDAKAAVQKFEGSADAKIRLAVYDAQLALSRKTKKLLTEGLSSEILPVRHRAIERSLQSKNKKLRLKAVQAVASLMCSKESALADLGRLLEVQVRGKKEIRALQEKLVECPNSGRTEWAKQSIIARGGKRGWSLIAKSLEQTDDLEAKREAAAQAIRLKSKAAAEWAIKRIHQEDETGKIAREIMMSLGSSRLGKRYIPVLKRSYRRAKKEGDFAKRVRLAMILGNLGAITTVQDTLFAAFHPDYRPPEGIVDTQSRAWKGLRNVRSLKILNRVISKKHDLKMKDLFCQLQEEKDAEEAFEWLYRWTRKSQSSKLYAVLERCFMSDYLHSRIQAIEVLAKLGHRKHLSLFEKALTESNGDIRRAGARGIATAAGVGDEERLGSLLQRERSEDGKLALINGLARIGTAESIKPLKFMIFRQPRAVTLAAMNAMAATKDPTVAVNIAPLKNNSDEEIRLTAWRNLLRLNPDEYGPMFTRGAKSWIEPRHIVELGKVKEIPTSVFAELAKKSNPDVSAIAMRVLSKRGDEGASFLLEVIDEHKDGAVAAEALNHLAKLRKKKSLSYFVKCLTHQQPEVRTVAVKLVGRFGTRRKNIGDVMPLREDKSPAVQLAAFVATYKLAKKRR